MVRFRAIEHSSDRGCAEMLNDLIAGNQSDEVYVVPHWHGTKLLQQRPRKRKSAYDEPRAECWIQQHDGIHNLFCARVRADASEIDDFSRVPCGIGVEVAVEVPEQREIPDPHDILVNPGEPS